MSDPGLGFHHEHRRKVPYGIRFIQWLGRERTAAYRGSVLILTFFAYTSYHLSRKPISVVKGTLNPNCSKITASCHGWKPFDSPDSGDELLGALDLAFLFSYAVGMFFSGFVAEHMDLRHFLTVGMISSGLLTIAFGMAYEWKIHHFTYFVTVQVFSGFFQSSGWPSVVECVGNWFGKGRRGLIMGIWNSHTSVGNILGSAIAGVWASSQWGYSFIVPGCIICGMAVIVFLFLVVGYQDQEASSLPCYKMAKRPRGMCLIINNIIFEGHAEHEGAKLDEEVLKQLFKDLFFTVYVFKNLERNEMLNVAVDFAKKNHSEFDAFVFIVMSHGEDGDTISGVKGRPTRVKDLMHEFKAANCSTLRNKPKLFFIQTCRGSSNETLSPAWGGFDVDSAAVFSGYSTLPRGVCPREADFLLAFATAPGYCSWRHSQDGSLFIQTLVEAIREHHNNHHLLDILTEVNRRVAAREENQRVPVQVPASTHTLRGQLYL